MTRLIGVKIVHPRARFAKLVRLDRPSSRTRHFVTISPEQTEAEVEIHLLTDQNSGDLESSACLHTFYLNNLHPHKQLNQNEAIPVSLFIKAEYDGMNRLKISVLDQRRELARYQLDVRNEPRRIGKYVIGALMIVLVATIGIFLTLQKAPSERVTQDYKPAISRPKMQDNQAPAADTPAAVATPKAADSPAATDSPLTTTEQATDGPSTSSVSARGQTSQAVSKEPQAPIAEPQAPIKEPQAPALTQKLLVYFTPNQTYLTEQTKSTLNQIALQLIDAGDVKVIITGHAAIFGTEAGQYEISRERSQNVYDYLLSQGWEPDQAPMIDWKGPTEPVTFDPERQEINRRVEIKIEE